MQNMKLNMPMTTPGNPRQYAEVPLFASMNNRNDTRSDAFGAGVPASGGPHHRTQHHTTVQKPTSSSLSWKCLLKCHDDDDNLVFTVALQLNGHHAYVSVLQG
jgi:hypothetical protein